MKRKLLKTALIAGCFLLSGCMKIRIRLDVDGNGKVSSTQTLLLSNELLGMGGNDIDASLEELRQSTAESNPDAEVTIVKEEGTGEEQSFSGVAITEKDTHKYNVTVDRNTITVRIPRQNINEVVSEEIGAGASEDYDSEQLKELGFEAVMVVNMPAAAKTNAGVAEGKTVTIDLVELSPDIEEIVITSSTGKISPLLIGCGIAAVICILIFVLRKKKDQPENIA